MSVKRSKFTDIFERKNEAPVPVEPTRKLAKSKDPTYVPLTVYVRKDVRNKVQILLMGSIRCEGGMLRRGTPQVVTS